MAEEEGLSEHKAPTESRSPSGRAEWIERYLEFVHSGKAPVNCRIVSALFAGPEDVQDYFARSAEKAEALGYVDVVDALVALIDELFAQCRGDFLSAERALEEIDPVEASRHLADLAGYDESFPETSDVDLIAASSFGRRTALVLNFSEYYFKKSRRTCITGDDEPENI